MTDTATHPSVAIARTVTMVSGLWLLRPRASAIPAITSVLVLNKVPAREATEARRLSLRSMYQCVRSSCSSRLRRDAGGIT